MKNTFVPLERDDDVLLINQDTFTVRRFKELLEKALDTKLKETVHQNGTPLFTINFCTLSIGNELKLLLNDVQWCNFSTDCQLLQPGSQGWQKGKIRIQVNTKILWSEDKNKIHACVEFCPDEPAASESSLDDLQQSK
jgi:hypothetical protein